MASRDDQPDILYVIHDGERIVVALDMPGVRGAVEERANSAVELACLVPYPVADNGSPLRDSTISQEPPGLRAARAWYGTGAVVGLSAGAVDRGALRDKRDELEQILVDLPTDTGVWHQVGDRVEQLDAALAAFDGEVDTRLAAFTDLSEHCRRYVREDRAITRPARRCGAPTRP